MLNGQHLWVLGIDWDTAPPDDICSQSSTFQHSLSLVETLEILRFVIADHYASCDMYGFCDASSTNYAAVIYLLTAVGNGTVKVHLLIAKSKVAPLKTLFIPRLELFGALLLAELFSFVHTTFLDHIKIDNVYAWCDSNIVLQWIHSERYR